MDCLEADTVIAFVDGRLPPDALSAAQQHVATCPSCADLVAAVASADDDDDDDATAARFEKGASIGRYVILDRVGRGGMGEVYAAYDPQLDRRVALKLLHERTPPGVSVASARARLLREAKAIARLSHPNVVVVHDAGEIDDRVFLAMEFVDGDTLGAWLQAAPRGWREIRDAFCAAGQGLAAAHEAGLVHRDFKPQNVMVARDGAVRVMDFGLASDAAKESDGAPAEPVSRVDSGPLTAHSVALTNTGMLLGTPLYMAPEQLLGHGTDQRTDQFSFCVALYHALYGERPFPSESLQEMLEAVVAGRVREPSHKSRAPAFLRKLLLRGLRPDPELRFPSMRALLEALRRDPARRRRGLALGAAATALAVLAGVGVQRLVTRGERLCRGAGEKLAAAWEPAADAARRSAVHRAFLGTERGYAEETWKLVSGLLDDYSRRWAAMYTDTCEATHVRGDQSAEVMDLRMTCLEEPRGALRALTDVLSRADGAVLVEAVNAAQALPAIDRCANVPLLRAVVAPPSDAATRRRVEEIRAGLAGVKALNDTGQWAAGREKAVPLVAAARAAGYPPVVAEALEADGLLQYHSGELGDAAKTLEEALWTALSSRRDDVALRCAAILVAISGYFLAHPQDSERWDRLGQALLQRLGPGHEQAAAWLSHSRGLSRTRRGDLRGALDDLRAGLALKRKVLPSEHADIAISWEGIANVLSDAGDHAGALAAMEESLKIYELAYGPNNPRLARPLGNRGEFLAAVGRYHEAEADLRESIERWSGYVGADHPWVAYALTALGTTLLAEGRPGEAVLVLERALRIRERAEPNAEMVAQTRFALARALWDEGDDRPRARALAGAARDAYVTLPAFAARAPEIDAWLQQHPAGAKRELIRISDMSP